MKLVILCGSLEPGKDGVGDYSRRLADFCRSRGHQVLLGALNDPWVESSSDYNDPYEIRFPKTVSWSQRMINLEAALHRFQPDLVSLQFVPFSFHDRGLCHQLVSGLQSLKSVKRWHIMFHELWLGLEPAQPMKYKILGYFQKRICLKLINTLKAGVVHTHSATYAAVLQREDIAAKQLPLFSNIDITSTPDYWGLYQLLAKNGSSIFPATRSEKYVAVFFGSLHPEWNASLLMQKLKQPDLIFLAIGRLGKIGQEIWREFSENYRSRAEFIHLGELTPEEISTSLQFADAGIASSPWNLIEKSGSVAAMIEHGLPVIVTRNDFMPAADFPLNPFWLSRLYPVWEDSFNAKKLVKNSPTGNLDKVGVQFLNDLEESIRAK